MKHASQLVFINTIQVNSNFMNGEIIFTCDALSCDDFVFQPIQDFTEIPIFTNNCQKCQNNTATRQKTCNSPKTNVMSTNIK